MPFDLQVQHADMVRGTIQFYNRHAHNRLRSLIAPDLWSNQSFCVEWLRRMDNTLATLVPLIPSAAWSDRSFCLAFAPLRAKNCVSLNTLRPLIAPALWTDQSFCVEWVQHMYDTAGELRPLVTDDIWSDEPFCVERAKHMDGELGVLFERFPAYRSIRKIWFLLFSGKWYYQSWIEPFREAVKQTPALSEDAELMQKAMRCFYNKRPLFCGTIAPSLFEERDFFRRALRRTGCQVLEVISHHLQRRFLEVILQCFSEHKHEILLGKDVWSYLAPDLRENRSICVQWIRGHYGANDEKVPAVMIHSREFWLELAPFVKESHRVADHFRTTCPFLDDEDFAVGVCALAHETCTTQIPGSAQTTKEVKQLYNKCKLKIRDRVRADECYMLALELEPTMNVPGLREEFADYLGVSSEKEVSELKAIWRKYH